nr:hypothetical protein Y25C1A.7a - Caenorhabditis elegans [Caenorhabditis elegans]
MDLNFQNFDNVNSTNEQSGAFGGNIGDRNILVGGSVGATSSAAPSGGVFDDSQSTTSTRKGNFFSFEYYQQFFDVETDQVIKRLLNSVIPTHRNYIQDFLQPIPDLWGPFWVSVTLVFAIGIFGNLAQFIENDGAKGTYGSDFRMAKIPENVTEISIFRAQFPKKNCKIIDFSMKKFQKINNLCESFKKKSDFCHQNSPSFCNLSHGFLTNGNLKTGSFSEQKMNFYTSFITSASTLIFLYVVIVPLLLYGLLWNRRSELLHPYVDLVCLYGYSLAIFIPVSVLWIVDIGWFRWALIFASVGLSGTVLARAIWPAVQNDNNKMIAFGTVISVVVLHFLLAFTFKVYFFDSMHIVVVASPSPI